jgi:transposase
MSSFLSIRALREEGVPKKTIARRLGIDVRTVRKYIRRIELGAQEPRRARVPQKLDPHRERIESMVQRGLSAVQIWQDLRREPSFTTSYETVKRLVRELRPVDVKVYSRLDFRPGEEAQIDFGDVGRMNVGGQQRRGHLFVMTLCFSRYAFYDLVTDQTVPTFLGAIRRGFEFFGGAPERLKPDNLRSAVLVGQLGERHYQEDFFRFCQHYGTVPDAARPATPTDKGRVERDIGYAKGNWRRGREFDDFDHALVDLHRWRDEIANVRTHGTTRRRPVDLMDEERSHLRPLPTDPFEISSWGRYKVRKDIHVHVRGNYYSVPHRLAGREVSIRTLDDKLTVFADGGIVAEHREVEGKGHTVTDPEHLPVTKRIATQEIHRRRVMLVREAGPFCAEFVGRLGSGRGVRGDQIARLARLVTTHGAENVDRACERALYYEATDSAMRIERILERGLHHRSLPHDAISTAGPDNDFGRALREYEMLLGCEEVPA